MSGRVAAAAPGAPLPRPLTGEHGLLPFETVAYEVAGRADLPAVAVLGGISATRHAAPHARDPRAGWWEEQAGPGRGIDTTRFRTVGIDYLGSTLQPGDAVPWVDTRDQARALAAALDDAGIERLHAVVGASYGGAVALAFGALFPERANRVVMIGAAHEPHPMATAVRAVQRRIVALGRAAGDARGALALARMLAMTTYRGAEEFAARFSAHAHTADGAEVGEPHFPVEEYLEHQGARYAEQFTPERFVCLSRSMDLHRVGPAAVRVPTTLIAITGDAIAPPWQMRALAARLGGPAMLHEVPSRFGHDAFLKESAEIRAILIHALNEEPRA